MLVTEKSVGIIPKMKLRILLYADENACKQRGPTWLWNPGQTSPEVQNSGISDPTNISAVLQKFNLEKYEWSE